MDNVEVIVSLLEERNLQDYELKNRFLPTRHTKRAEAKLDRLLERMKVAGKIEYEGRFWRLTERARLELTRIRLGIAEPKKRYDPKACRDCGKRFIPLSGRQVRCFDCYRPRRPIRRPKIRPAR